MWCIFLVIPATAQTLRTSKNWGIRELTQHWPLTDKHETLVVEHNLDDNVSVGLTTHFWVEAGRGPEGRYLCDTMIVRYYVDGETTASLAFTPSMAAGSGVGFEGQAYYAADQRVFPRGSKPCNETDQCGMDLLDGWPWQTRWTGKGGSEGNWILHFRVPFLRSLRITAQLASSAPHVDPRFSRSDIPPGASTSAFFMVRGVEGPEDQLRIALGQGSLLLPLIRTHRVRLRLYHLSNHTPTRGEFVPFGQHPLDVGTSGAVLMTTVSLQGIHTVQNDVEMCWWALTSATAAYNNSDHFLLGTGMEDFFANSFTLSRLTRTYFHDDAGLTHVHGGPQDACPNPPGAPFTTCNADFRTQPPRRFSAYRIFDKDPLLFDDRYELAARYLPPGKCSLRSLADADAVAATDAPGGDFKEGAATDAPGGVFSSAPWGTRFDAYTWFYTFERNSS